MLSLKKLQKYIFFVIQHLTKISPASGKVNEVKTDLTQQEKRMKLAS